MVARSKTAIKSFFETGDFPSQSNFGDLIDSYQDINTLPTLYYTDTGTANTYVITAPSFATLASLIGIPIYVKITNSNVGASTLNVNSFGAITIAYINGSSLVNNALPGGAIAGFIYDGTEFQFINISPSTGGAFINALTGDVTASGSGSVVATIASNAITTSKISDNNVTLAKLATQAADTVLANATSSPAVPTAVALSASQLLGKAGSGNIAAITPNTGLVFSGTNLNVDVGITASKIVQLDGSARLPAVDGSQLLGLPGSYVLLGSATASSSATLDFTSLITSTYDVYVFELDGLVSSAGGDMWMRISTDNSTYITSGYYGAGNQSDSTPTNTPKASATNAMTLIFGLNAAGANGFSGTVKFYAPLGTVNRKMIISQMTASLSNNSPLFCNMGLGNNTGNAVLAVRFLPSSGNFTSGVIRMYGIKNS